MDDTARRNAVPTRQTPKDCCGDESSIRYDCRSSKRQMVLQMYHEVDRIIADPRFQSVNHVLPSRLEERSLDSLGRSQFEVITANVLPFDVDATAETLWAMWMQRSYGLMKTTRLHDHHATEDGVTRVFEGVLQTKSENARVVTKNVVRRFVEADRVVMTAIALMQLVDLDGKQMDDVYTRAQV
ncbi:hypothetical protein Poli38472_011675 [Pythium oligandrum]|uniref:Uncharacterized protein n=1 Tax=Pythium oligandrum TaxID=41045 RepID=A0A8K1C7P8_PYTOL|nr:hypothetical protein Poli38472_011675 [Pythium oligandrum]|eukprot:TMW58087.1 hypothetical protein Poli38472_011675 [Pythium oligandrum]